ncbi:MAG TPA: nucleotidyltransferase family protein [Gemmatimonadaceae bacterium]|nr:nucleotidyltransferase family protein [Gemmatimonadaceae bacterium]
MDHERPLANVTVAILAGGLGTRLRAVVADRPKALAPVNGRPFLAWLLSQAQGAGVPHAVVCTGHLGDQIESAFGTSFDGMSLTYSREPAPLGTGGALRRALPMLRSDPVLVVNGDSYCNADLRDFARAHDRRHADVSIMVTSVADAGRFGSVTLGANNRVQGFEEKVAGRGKGWINAGLYLISRPLIERIPVGPAVSLERDAFPRWLGDQFFAYRSAGPFIDIGTPESYADAEKFFSDYHPSDD